MSLTEFRRETSRPPSRGLRWRLRDLADRACTPTGAAVLAALALAAGVALTSFVALPGSPLSRARAELASVRGHASKASGEAALRTLQAQRLRAIQGFSSRYGIPADLSARVYDIANSEGLEPELAFSLVQTESSFRRWAVSGAGAVGYTQLKPSTARWLDPTADESALFEPETNLHLGFRYLSILLHQYDGDMHLALLAYNRGPGRVGILLASGVNPSNGYARRVMRGQE